MSKLGWFIGGAVAGVAGIIAAAHLLEDEVDSDSLENDQHTAFEDTEDNVTATLCGKWCTTF